MEVRIQITIRGMYAAEASAIKNALEPDNVDFPDGITFEMENLDNALVFNFQSTKNMKKLTSTVDEVLAHTQMALKVIK